MFSLAVFKENELAQQMMNKPYRIAITGFVGTGKTSLCQALSERLSLPIINEDMVDLVQAGGQYRQAIKGNTTIEMRQQAKGRFVNAFVEWSEARAKLYQSLDGFVADRCELDLLNWWLVEFGKGSHGLDKISNKLLQDLHNKIKLFDYVVVMPFARPFIGSGSHNERGVERKSDYTTHLLYHNLSLGLIHSVDGSAKSIFIPSEMLSIEERTAHVVNFIKR